MESRQAKVRRANRRSTGFAKPVYSQRPEQNDEKGGASIRGSAFCLATTDGQEL